MNKRAWVKRCAGMPVYGHPTWVFKPGKELKAKSNRRLRKAHKQGLELSIIALHLGYD